MMGRSVFQETKLKQILIVQVFLWKVPDGFTLQTDNPEEIADVSPVSRLAGHSRYAMGFTHQKL